MGNCSSVNQHHHPFGATARVILWDGTVRCFDDPITVAELMIEHPRQVVVEFDPATVTAAGKRATPLPADRMLDIRKIYFMLPVKGGKPALLSSDGARRVLSMANSLLLAPTVSGFMPLLAKMCTAGGVHDEVLKKDDGAKLGDRMTMAQDEVLKKDDGAKLEDRMTMARDAWCGSGGTEYLSRQISGKGWKPSLDTIVEKKFENRVSHWLFSS